MGWLYPFVIMFSVITDVLNADRVLRLDVQPPINSQQAEIIRYCEAAVIEQHVMIGAEAQQVIQHIWAVMWCPKRSDMRGFCVGSG